MQSIEEPWARLVWRAPIISKHSFIVWLTINDRLHTRLNMENWGMSVDISCLLCKDGMDDINHLFYDCPFICKIRSYCFGRILPFAPCWKRDCDEVVELYFGKSAEACSFRLLWRGMIESVCYERCRRNACKQENAPLAQKICRETNSVNSIKK